MGRATVSWAAAVLVGAACFASPARGADRIYWANSPSTPADHSISFAKLDGTGGGNVTTTGATLDGPYGVGLDPAAGRVYWVNTNANRISFARLDGSGGGGDLNTSGATINGPRGVAVDHLGGRIYWANYDGSKISFANLDGSGGGDINTGSATVNAPIGVAVDRTGGRIYWANSSGAAISFADLDGSGGGDINTNGASTPANAHGVALDLGAGRIYWADNAGMSAKISYARLDGTGGADVPVVGAPVTQPVGVTLDTAAGRIYWANLNKIAFAALDGSGGGELNTTGATASSTAMPALLERPSGVAPPAITGGVPRGSTLSCSNGDWAADLVHELRYLAPTSFGFQWSRDGAEIAGATSNSILAGSPGTYVCRVTATNEAGSTLQTSAAHTVLAAFGSRTLVTLKLASRRIPARGPVKVRVANANGFQITGRLSGKRLKAKRFSAAAHAKKTVKLKLPARLRRALTRKHKLRLPLTARVKDPAGQARTVRKRVTLRLRRR